MANIIALKDFCEANDLPFERVKRLARKDGIEGAKKFLGRWGIPADAPVPVLPEVTRTGGARKDGRFVYRIWATPTEAVSLIANGYRMKRANPKKLKDGDATVDGDGDNDNDNGGDTNDND